MSNKTSVNERIEAINKNCIDSVGIKVVNVLSKGNEYVIYEIDDDDINNRLRVMIDGHTDESEKVLQERFTNVKQKYIEAKGLLYRSSNFGMMKNRIAHTLASCLVSENIDGNQEFQKLINNIKSEYKNLIFNRLLYILPTFIVVIIFSVMFLLNITDTNSVLSKVYLIGFGSSLGGIMSILYRIKSYNFEEYLDKKYYFFIGFERSVIAIVAGIIIYIGVKSGLIFPNFNMNNIWVTLFLMILAGFSESFVPSILNKFSVRDS
jgi:hypothetical protein